MSECSRATTARINDRETFFLLGEVGGGGGGGGLTSDLKWEALGHTAGLYWSSSEAVAIDLGD